MTQYNNDIVKINDPFNNLTYDTIHFSVTLRSHERFKIKIKKFLLHRKNKNTIFLKSNKKNKNFFKQPMLTYMTHKLGYSMNEQNDCIGLANTKIPYTEDRCCVISMNNINSTYDTNLSSIHQFDNPSGIIECDSRFNIQIICDGHGGFEISNFATQFFFEYVNSNKLTNDTCITEYLTILVNEINNNVQTNFPNTKCGSTLIILCIDRNDNLAYVANLGDSRCIIARKNNVGIYEKIFSTIDLSCDNVNEVERLKLSGHNVVMTDGTNRIEGCGLQPTAGLGDNYYFIKNNKLNPIKRDPDIDIVNLQAGDIILLSSDGFYEGPVLCKNNICIKNQKSDQLLMNQINELMKESKNQNNKLTNWADKIMEIHYNDMLLSYTKVIFDYWRLTIKRYSDKTNEELETIRHQLINIGRKGFSDEEFKKTLCNLSDNQTVLLSFY